MLIFVENDADAYQVPYEDILPNNPTFEQMRDVVCTRKIRPPTSARWLNHSVGFYSILKKRTNEPNFLSYRSFVQL
jgi:hypothetical protein